jgi:hypothetical protein
LAAQQSAVADFSIADATFLFNPISAGRGALWNQDRPTTPIEVG